MKNSNYISIRQYLENKGINLAKDRGYYGMYSSPFRKDTNPSFKVDYGKDLWHDFGTGGGGSIIDLVMKLENCPLAEAFQRLDDTSFSFHRNKDISYKEKHEQSATIRITDVQDLTNVGLLRFLRERCIDAEIAQQYCKEVHYTVKDKPYYAIGFQNDAGGWALRNKKNAF